MPVTPYSVSNGSFSRNSYSFALLPQEINSATAMATSTIKTHSPMPPAASSVMRTAETESSLSPPSPISAIGENTHSIVASAILGAAARRSAR